MYITVFFLNMKSGFSPIVCIMFSSVVADGQEVM